MQRLVSILNGLLGLAGYELVHRDSSVLRLPPSLGPAIETARPLVAKQEGTLGVSPEFRRHQVYAALLKRFPAIPALDISLAIERALRDLRGLD